MIQRLWSSDRNQTFTIKQLGPYDRQLAIMSQRSWLDENIELHRSSLNDRDWSDRDWNDQDWSDSDSATLMILARDSQNGFLDHVWPFLTRFWPQRSIWTEHKVIELWPLGPIWPHNERGLSSNWVRKEVFCCRQLNYYLFIFCSQCCMQSSIMSEVYTCS